MTVELRPYQKECIDIVDNLPDGARTIVCLATGLGKTVTAANFTRKGRILWLSHRDELVRQPEKYFEGISYGIEQGSEHPNGETVVSASIQTISRDKRLNMYKPDEFDLVILDEAQHAAAKTYRKVLDHFKPRKLIGLTATPKRGDGVRLSDVFDDICFVRDLRWGIRNGYLSPIRCVRVSADFDVKRIKKSMGDLMASSISEAMDDSNDDLVVTKAYMDYCLPEHKKALIYCPTVKICNKVYETMKDALDRTDHDKIAVLSDGCTVSERRKILERYISGGLDCIINCMILTEGTDLPNTSVIINNRPTANASLYQQIIGRGTRLCEGKDYCLIIDVVGKNSAGRDICTAPTLFGLDPDKLPEKIVKELEGGDLLTLAEDLTGAGDMGRGDAAINIRLRRELIDIFTGQRLKLIRDNIGKGLKKVAMEYSKTLSPDGSGMEFGDIMVKTTPEEDRYYCVPATYNGNIFLSKPDMLGRVTVTVDIPKNETIDGTRWDGISKPMPKEDAVRLLGDILEYSVKKDYVLRWSRTARANMDRSHATDKQLSYVLGLYKTENGQPDTRGLSKLQASDLIDLDHEVKSLKRKGDELSRLEARGDKRKKTEENSFKRRNETYKRIVLDTYKRKNGMTGGSGSQGSENIRNGYVTVDIDYSHAGNIGRTMTNRQRDLLFRLQQENASRRKVLDCCIPIMDAWRAGVMIQALINIGNIPLPPKGKECRFAFEKFISELKGISPDGDVKYLTLDYAVDVPIPVFEEIST